VFAQKYLPPQAWGNFLTYITHIISPIFQLGRICSRYLHQHSDQTTTTFGSIEEAGTLQINDTSHISRPRRRRNFRSISWPCLCTVLYSPVQKSKTVRVISTLISMLAVTLQILRIRYFSYLYHYIHADHSKISYLTPFYQLSCPNPIASLI
jgi:hypothetical protein